MRKSTDSPLICCVDESHLYRERNEVELLRHRRACDRLTRLRDSAQRRPHTYRASALRFLRTRAHTCCKCVRCDKSWPAGGGAQINATIGECTLTGCR